MLAREQLGRKLRHHRDAEGLGPGVVPTHDLVHRKLHVGRNAGEQYERHRDDQHRMLRCRHRVLQQ